MIILDATTKSLEVKLNGAVTTNQLPFVASYADLNSSFAVTAVSEVDGTTNGANAVTVVAAPGASTSRKVAQITIQNADTVSATVTLQINNNGTKRVLCAYALGVGYTLTYSDGTGFAVTDASGNLVTQLGGVLPAANFPALSGDVSTTAGSLVTAIGASKVTNAMLAGSIAASKLVGTDIATVGTITSGVWNAGALTSSGVLTINGFGTHPISSGGTGGNLFSVRNTTAGTGNYGRIDVGNDAGSDALQFIALSSTFTSSAPYFASGGTILVNQSGGLAIAASHASGPIRFYSGGTTLRAQINTNGTQTWAPYGAGTATFDASGNITSVSDERIKDIQGPFLAGLNALLNIRPILYRYKSTSNLDQENTYAGFSAQNVLGYIPEAVGKNLKGEYSLNIMPLLAAAVTAIQELSTEIDSVRAALGLPVKDRAVVPIIDESRIINSATPMRLAKIAQERAAITAG